MHLRLAKLCCIIMAVLLLILEQDLLKDQEWN